VQAARESAIFNQDMQKIEQLNRGGTGKEMWTAIMDWAGRNLRGRYVLMLEEEVERLRAENRALVNSLLGTAGFPPISLDEEVRRGAGMMSPVRRRTWTQIARERELAAGKNTFAASAAKSSMEK
jgi:hypothetical protein